MNGKARLLGGDSQSSLTTNSRSSRIKRAVLPRTAAGRMTQGIGCVDNADDIVDDAATGAVDDNGYKGQVGSIQGLDLLRWRTNSKARYLHLR